MEIQSDSVYLMSTSWQIGYYQPIDSATFKKMKSVQPLIEEMIIV
jgi:hypothetical protein